MLSKYIRYLLLSIFVLFTFHNANSYHPISNYENCSNFYFTKSIFSHGYHTLKNYKIWFINREKIDYALYKMLRDSLKYNKKERWIEILFKDSIIQKGDNRINDYSRNNYIVDQWGVKEFLFYYEPTKTFYWLSVLGCSIIGLGCDLCITSYFIDDGKHSLKYYTDKNIEKKERRIAIKTFNKKLLPILKKQIWKMRNYRP